MLCLAVDTSGIAASAAVADENKLIGEFYTDYKIKHSEKLMPLVDGVLKNVGLHISDIDLFAYNCGPGSFTGLRIGAASVKGFAQATGKGVVAVPTTESLAMGLSFSNALVCPILDAQRNQVYTALYDCSEMYPRLISGKVRAVGVDELINELKDKNCGKVLFTGDAVIKYKEYIQNAYCESEFAPATRLMPHAANIAFLALRKAGEGCLLGYDQIDVEYIRSSDAEVNFKTKL